MSMQVLIPVDSRISDDALAFIREMGVEYVEHNIGLDEANADSLIAARDRFAEYGLSIAVLSCNPLQKNAAIDLGKPERDGEIEKFKDFVRAAGQADIRTVSIAWQPNGILRTGRCPLPHTRGGVSAYADMEQIDNSPILNDREYSNDEIWSNFEYFIDAVVPTCRECGVRMALHPNDPPVPNLGGVASLIYRTEDYKRAFKLAGNDVLGMKLCVGCWLEGGEAFGDLFADIREFVDEGRIFCVHFRNVSDKIPYFEETLAEDGYANMYDIMKQFVACGYDGPISIDHAFAGYPSMGGMVGAFAYPTGYMKGLISAAETEFGK